MVCLEPKLKEVVGRWEQSELLGRMAQSGS
jgi:hypothetical protein